MDNNADLGALGFNEAATDMVVLPFLKSRVALVLLPLFCRISLLLLFRLNRPFGESLKPYPEEPDLGLAGGLAGGAVDGLILGDGRPRLAEEDLKDEFED